jgi:Sortase domain
LRQTEWRRIGGFRVVGYWRPSAFAPPPSAPASLPSRIASITGVLLILGGIMAVGIALLTQRHAPQPSAAAAGAIGPGHHGPWLRRSTPESLAIPSIGVYTNVLHLGRATDGSIQVPSLDTQAEEAAWYKYSVTPGQIGASVIEGHVDTYQGPAVFFRLGALRPGDLVDVNLADGTTAVFRVTGVREYPKSRFPAGTIFGATDYAALRLITCGGAFDYATGHYLSSTVVFASLISQR